MVVAEIHIPGYKVSQSLPNLIENNSIKFTSHNSNQNFTNAVKTTMFVLLYGSMKSFGCGTNKHCDKEAMKLVKQEYKNLGSMSFAEVSVLVLFVLLVLLWVTREPGFMPGWGSTLFNKDRT